MNMHERRQIINPKRREQIVFEGRLLIYPELAKKILSECYFEGQTQRMNDVASVHIKRHVDHMSRGIWRTSFVVVGIRQHVVGRFRQRVQFDALVERGAGDGVEVIAKGCAARGGYLHAAAALAGRFSRRRA